MYLIRRGLAPVMMTESPRRQWGFLFVSGSWAIEKMVGNWLFEMESENEEASDTSGEDRRVRNPQGRTGRPKCQTCRQKKVKVTLCFIESKL